MMKHLRWNFVYCCLGTSDGLFPETNLFIADVGKKGNFTMTIYWGDPFLYICIIEQNDIFVQL